MFLRSGMTLDRKLFELHRRELERLAILDLREERIEKIKRLEERLRQNGQRNPKRYNKDFKRLIKMKREFATDVYVLNLMGLKVPSDSDDLRYKEEILEKKKQSQRKK
jgi:hypothetical protein